MQLSEFNFPFDASLIATVPVLPRDQAKLLVLNRSNRSMTHSKIAALPKLLASGDLLVVNDTRVRSARVTGKRRTSGAAVEVLFVKEVAERNWEVLIRGRWRPGQVIDIDAQVSLTIVSREAGTTIVRLDGALSASDVFRLYGRMPLPPYIRRKPNEKDQEWYQTVFAHDEGAIAAPTAGLHFTSDLLACLADRRIDLAKVTLHVGLGTFKPVTVDRIEDHRMGAEWVEVGRETVQAVRGTKERGGKVVAVGTTVVRALESAAREEIELRTYRGDSSLFITPGFDFRVVDAILTNFHLPQTTLLMLVSAFAGHEFLREAYEEAVRERYRFYSYGDAMLIV